MKRCFCKKDKNSSCGDCGEQQVTLSIREVEMARMSIEFFLSRYPYPEALHGKPKKDFEKLNNDLFKAVKRAENEQPKL